MMTGPGRVTVGESAASKKYRMTLAADKKLVSPPPVESNNTNKTIPVTVPRPPDPPRPARARPTPPRKAREWEDHGWMWRLQHHMHMYNHSRAVRKAERAESEKRDFARHMDHWREDQARYDREKREYDVKMEAFRHFEVVLPPPPKPTLEQLSDYDRAVVGLRKQQQQISKRREQHFNYVLETQTACQANYNKAMELLLLPGSEALAALKAKDYLNATRELDKAKNKYFSLCDDEQRIVDTLDAAVDAQFQKELGENLGVVSERISDDRSEINDLKEELKLRNVPESVILESQQANKDLAAVLAEMQEKIKNETRHDLGIDMPQQHQNTGRQLEPSLISI